MAVDPQLRTLIECAEAGQPSPPVKVITGAAWISGTPASTAAFSAAMQQALEVELWVPFRDTGGKNRKEEYLQYMESLKPTWQAVVQAQQHSTELILTLVDVEMAPPAGGDGLSVPSLRVPIGAIDSWWFAGAKRVPAKGTWAFGAAFPLPDLG